MIREVPASVLTEVSRQVLEDAAFLFLSRGPGAPPSAGRRLLEAVLEFRAPGQGRVGLRTTEALAVEIAGNMLGLEPGDPDAVESASDALGELLNILSGALVVRLFGAGTLCLLGQPQVAEAETPRPRGVETWLVADSGDPIGVFIELNRA